jgi:hypothetical protein
MATTLAQTRQENQNEYGRLTREISSLRPASIMWAQHCNGVWRIAFMVMFTAEARKVERENK